MKYSEAFTDWEKRREEAGWEGFKYKKFSSMYYYLQQRASTRVAESFNSLTKRQKRLFCARVVYFHHSNTEMQEKAKKYLDKHKGEDDILW